MRDGAVRDGQLLNGAAQAQASKVSASLSVDELWFRAASPALPPCWQFFGWLLPASTISALCVRMKVRAVIKVESRATH